MNDIVATISSFLSLASRQKHEASGPFDNIKPLQLAAILVFILYPHLYSLRSIYGGP